MAFFLSDTTHDRLRTRDDPAATVPGGGALYARRDSRSSSIAVGGGLAPNSNNNVSLRQQQSGASSTTTTLVNHSPPVTAKNNIPGGIEFFAGFNAQMRCCEVASIGATTTNHSRRDEAGSSTKDMLLWSGDIDGDIVIRKGLLGTPTGERIPASREKGNVFVFCMARFEDHMWCGYSDGYIAVFDIETKKCIKEIKAHAKAVNCLLLINNQYIVSGGSDWQIMQWDPVAVEKRPFPHGQLSGHQNAVRCLACDGAFLYSGGDDSAIRCWDLDTGLERDDPWPICRHENSVRTIAVYDVFIFSASMDGTVKVWNAQTTQLVRELDSEPVPVNSLTVDHATGRVWAGSTSGSILVWDIQSLNQIALLNDHHETHVPLIKVIARENAVKVWSWSAGDKNIRIWYSDNAGGGAFQDLVNQTEINLQLILEGKRKQVMENYFELERRIVRAKELEKSDQNRKHAVASVFGTRAKAALQQSSLHRQRTSWQKALTDRFQQTAVERLESCSHRMIFWRYWNHLLNYKLKKQRLRRNEAVARHLNTRREVNLEKQYMYNLLESTRRTLAQRKREQIAELLGFTAEETTRRYTFFRWISFFRDKHRAKKRAEFGVVFQRQTQDAIKQIYWSKLLRFLRKERSHETHVRSALTCAIFYDRSVLANYLHKWMNFLPLKKMQRQNMKTSIALRFSSDRVLMTDVYRRWNLLIKQKHSDAAAEKLQLQKDNMAEMEETLAACDGVTQEELEEIIRSKQAELARILAENEDLDDELEEALERERYLERELVKDLKISYDKPKPEQLNQAMLFLKAKGVSSFHDRELIAEIRESAKKSSPEKVYATGVAFIRKTCTRLMKPAKLIDEPGDSYWHTKGMFFKNRPIKKRVTKKLVAEVCAKGLCPMVTAFDMLNVGQTEAWLTRPAEEGEDAEWSPKHAHNEEVIVNFHTLLEFAIRQHRIRRNEDPVTGESLVKVGAKKKLRGKSKALDAAAAVGEKAAALKKKKAAAKKKKVAGQKPKKKKKAAKKTAGTSDAPKKKKKKVAKKKKKNPDEDTVDTADSATNGASVVAPAEEKEEKVAVQEEADGRETAPPSEDDKGKSSTRHYSCAPVAEEVASSTNPPPSDEEQQKSKAEGVVEEESEKKEQTVAVNSSPVEQEEKTVEDEETKLTTATSLPEPQYETLHMAARFGDLDSIRALVARGANVNESDKFGETPVHEAASKGFHEVVRLLHELGADLSKGDQYENTPVSSAIVAGHLVVVRTLHDCGVDLMRADSLGKTPLKLAKEEDQPGIVSFLKDLEANEFDSF